MAKFIPKPHQQDIIDALQNHDILSVWSEAGSGKTASILYALTQRYLDLDFKGVLIVAPRLSIDLTWPNEIEDWDFCRWMNIADLRTAEGQASWKNGTANIFLINYDRLDRLPELFKSNIPVDTVIFDEITKMKNPQSIRAKAWNGTHVVEKNNNSLRRHFKYAYGLTGTPMGNHLSDLFGQTLALDKGERLGRYESNFHGVYFEKGWNGYTLKPRPGAEDAIRNAIADITLSIPTPTGIGVSPIIYEDVEVPLDNQTKKVYIQAQKDFVITLQNKDIPAVSIAVLLDKLQQLTSGAVYSKNSDLSKFTNHAHNLKIDALEKIAKKSDNLLVFHKYEQERERILAAFPDAQELTPKTVPLWNAGKIKMLVAHPASAGHSLNLQAGGNEIIWFSLCHSGELYNQANSRLQRIGQKMPVRVRRLLCPGTVDFAIADALRKKSDAEANMKIIIRNVVKISKNN